MLHLPQDSMDKNIENKRKVMRIQKIFIRLSHILQLKIKEIQNQITFFATSLASKGTSATADKIRAISSRAKEM